MRIAQSLAAVVLCAALAGCLSLTDREERRLAEVQSFGLEADSVQIKDPVTACWWNLAGGLGNFYLAWDTEQFAGTDMWIAGVTNVLMWPASPLWSMREAYVDAQRLNTKATLDYYYHTSEGLRIIEAMEASKGARALARSAAAD